MTTCRCTQKANNLGREAYLSRAKNYIFALKNVDEQQIKKTSLGSAQKRVGRESGIKQHSYAVLFPRISLRLK